MHVTRWNEGFGSQLNNVLVHVSLSFRSTNYNNKTRRGIPVVKATTRYLFKKIIAICKNGNIHIYISQRFASEADRL